MVIPVVKKYMKPLRQMLGDVPNITLIPLFNNYTYRQQNVLLEIGSRLGLKNISLGRFDSNYFSLSGMRLDEIFYFQGKLPLEVRWAGFKFNPSLEKEQILLEKYKNALKGPYVFLHEDPSRGFVIDRSRIHKEFIVIEPDPTLGFTIFDYRNLINNASEVHCIESSFSIFIDQLAKSNQKLFAHRYSRPEAKNSFRHEINYKRDWKIIL